MCLYPLLDSMQPISGELGEENTYRFVPDTIEDSETIPGEIHLSRPIRPKRCEYPEFVETTEDDWTGSRLQITLTNGDETTGSLQIYTDNEQYSLPLLSAPAYYATEQALNTNVDEALNTIQKCYSSRWAWEFRNDCRDTLCFEAFADVLDSLAAQSNEFSHAQFRSGIGYFAKRIGDTIPQGISSFETLQYRISYWNELDNLKSVSLPEVLGEKLGRNWYRSGLESERAELLDIGFDPLTFDPDWSSVVPACWIAHLVLSEGIKEAEDFSRDRPAPDVESYDKLKKTARKADKNRGQKWGAVVAQTVHQQNNDFRFDGFNYLKHTADEYNKKAKFRPLLYAGAETLIPDHLPKYIHQEIKYKKEFTSGHNWRRDNAFIYEKEAFERAKHIARGGSNGQYEFDPYLFVEAESSVTYATVKEQSNPEMKIQLYETGIRNIKKIGDHYSAPNWKIEKEIKFLQDRMEEDSK